MLNIIQRSGLLISKKDQYKEYYIKIKEFLERRTTAYDKSNFIINKFYIESDKYLLIPRYFPIQQFTFHYKVVNHQHEGAPIEISHNITPRGDAQKKAIRYLMKNNNGILQLSPGVGKTVISIYMIAERKKKTMVLVHRDSLAKQWEKRFLEFTDLKIDDIARLTSVTFEDDLKKPIIIATVQTFRSLVKRKSEEFLTHLDNANVGVLVADEVHTSIGAPKLSECSIHIPARYTYGLSATPDRYDGNGDIIRFHLGDIFSDDDLEGTMDGKVTVILLDYQIDTPRSYRYVRWGGEFQRSRYLNMIKKSKPFRVAMRGLLGRLKKDRHLICVAERIKLIDELYKETKHESKGLFCGAGPKLEQLDFKVTFATPGKVRDGVDAPWKDCVVMTSPIRNIEQLIGRILRGEIEGKKTPIIIDMVDYGCPDISRTFYSRQKYYDKKEWPIQYLFFKDGKLNSIDREVAMEIMEGK
jgi:superfamily II DNA or RNA helicase